VKVRQLIKELEKCNMDKEVLTIDIENSRNMAVVEYVETIGETGFEIENNILLYCSKF
jgi:hypothetical protein